MRHHEEHHNAGSPLWPCKLAIGSRQHAVFVLGFCRRRQQQRTVFFENDSKEAKCQVELRPSVSLHWLQLG